MGNGTYGFSWTLTYNSSGIYSHTYHCGPFVQGGNLYAYYYDLGHLDTTSRLEEDLDRLQARFDQAGAYCRR